MPLTPEEIRKLTGLDKEEKIEYLVGKLGEYKASIDYINKQVITLTELRNGWIADLVALGMPYEVPAQVLDVSRQSISTWMKDYRFTLDKQENARLKKLLADSGFDLEQAQPD